MASLAYAALTANDTALEGDITVENLDDNHDFTSEHIECYSVTWGTDTGAETLSSRGEGHRRILPIVIRKRVDKSTPHLYQAMVMNQGIVGEIKFFNRDPISGENRHFFSLLLQDTAGHRARIVKILSVSPNCLDHENSNMPMYEDVYFAVAAITYQSVVDSVETVDNFRSQR